MKPEPYIPTEGEDRGVPFCWATCPHFTGVLCEITSNPIIEGRICPPAVREQSQRIVAAVELCEEMIADAKTTGHHVVTGTSYRVLAILKPEWSYSQTGMERMSNFTALTKHPETGEKLVAEWLDDYFGRHVYGVLFPDGKVFREHEIRWVERVGSGFEQRGWKQ